MFKVSLSNIKEGFSTLSSECLPAELDLADFPLTGPIHIELSVQKLGRNIILDANLQSPVEYVCDRCSDVFMSELQDKVRLILTSEADLQGQEEDLVFVISDHEQDLDIGPQLRETLILALPIKRLCSVDCRGLCPHCGTNLNITTCKCKTESIETRWDKLKDLFNAN